MSFFSQLFGAEEAESKEKERNYFEFIWKGKLERGLFQICGVTPRFIHNGSDIVRYDPILFLKRDATIFSVKESQILVGKAHKYIRFEDFIQN